MVNMTKFTREVQGVETVIYCFNCFFNDGKEVALDKVGLNGKCPTCDREYVL